MRVLTASQLLSVIMNYNLQVESDKVVEYKIIPILENYSIKFLA